MRDNGLNVSIHFMGLLLPNKSIQDLLESKWKLEVQGQSEGIFLEKEESNTKQVALKEVHSREGQVSWKHRLDHFQ